MGKPVQADSSAYDELRKLSKDIEASIRIEPFVLEPDWSDELDDTCKSCMLGVKISCGSDLPALPIWFPHDGKREGPDWERSKRIWFHCFEYLREYVGAVIMLSVNHLSHEVGCLNTDNETLLKEWFEQSPTLQRFYRSIGTAKKLSVPYESEFESMLGLTAFRMYERMTGKMKVRVGADSRLRFSPDEMRRLLERFDREHALWKRARNVFWTHENDPEWKAIVRAECAKIDAKRSLDDDLLEAIAQRTARGEFAYKPVEVAVVSAARYASFGNKEKSYSPPTISQHKVIRRAVDQWRQRFQEANQLGLQW